MYEYSEVVHRVNGLNSLSTLKKWRKKAEDLTGVKFREDLIRIGRNSSTSIFLFTEEDILKFQRVADTKTELGLDQAILKAFAKDQELPKPINERAALIEDFLVDLKSELKNEITVLNRENKRLKGVVIELEKRVVHLEEQPKRKGFFKSKN